MGDTLTSREKKLLPHIGLLLALLVILWIVFAPGRGMLALHRAQKEVERLQSDPAYLEDKARKEYGLLKDNELLYIFKKK